MSIKFTTETGYKSRYIIIFVIGLVLIFNFLYWYRYFSLGLKTENLGGDNGSTSGMIVLTEEQKNNLLSATSNEPIIILSETEKQGLLYIKDTKTNNIILTEEEKLRILGQKN